MTAALDARAPVAEQLPTLLAPSLEALLSRGDALLDVDATPDDLHRARLAAKALRYDLERFAELLPKRDRRTLRLVKSLQEQLGDVHDADVQADRIRRLLDDHGKALRRAVGRRSGQGAASAALADAAREASRAARELPVVGLTVVLAELVDDRERSRREAAEAWTGKGGGHLRRRLKRALRRAKAARP